MKTLENEGGGHSHQVIVTGSELPVPVMLSTIDLMDPVRLPALEVRPEVKIDFVVGLAILLDFNEDFLLEDFLFDLLLDLPLSLLIRFLLTALLDLL